MSSVLSFYAPSPAPPTKFFDVLTGSYEDTIIVPGDTVDMPIPYIVVNQVLDINTAQSSDVSVYISNGDSPDNSVTFQAKVMGGTNLIMNLGPNITTWLRNRIQNEESLGSAYSGPLELYVKPVMTKIQLAAPIQGTFGGPLNDESVYGITTEAPTSDLYIGGAPNSEYFTTWVFRKPMTVQYQSSIGPKYMTFTSQFSAN
jgi:hypothetical protein